MAKVEIIHKEKFSYYHNVFNSSSTTGFKFGECLKKQSTNDMIEHWVFGYNLILPTVSGSISAMLYES